MVEGKGVRRVVVANTHILANPEAPDVKIWQANTLTRYVTDDRQARCVEDGYSCVSVRVL